MLFQKDKETKHTPKKLFPDGKIPKLNPIEFIDYLENYYSNLFFAQISSSKFTTEKSPINEYPLVQFSQKKQISSLINSRKDISSIGSHNNNIFVGDSRGNIHMYLYDKQIYYQSFKKEDFQLNLEGIVKCIDCYNNFIFVGYSKGDIALWDVNARKCIYVITGVFSSAITALKIINVKKDYKSFDIIACDNDGSVQKITVKKGMFRISHWNYEIYKDKNATYGIELYKIRGDDDFQFIVAFATFNQAKIYLIDNSSSSLIEVIQKPKTSKSEEIGIDIALGMGYLPLSENDEDIYREQTLIFSMAIDKIILFYLVNMHFDHGKVKSASLSLEPSAHYNNDCEIIRIGFIANSFLYVISNNTTSENYCDQGKYITILNTILLPYGDYKITKDYMLYKPSTISKGKLPHRDLYANEFTDFQSNYKFYSYRDFILSSDMEISFFAENNFFRCSLYTYNDYILDLLEAEKWDTALILGINIYKGNVFSFPYINPNFLERKKEITPFLQMLIKNYITIILEDGNQDNKQIEECMNTSIDFCLNFDNVEFLFNEIMIIYQKHGYSDIFVKMLEPFIFGNKLKNETVSQTSIMSLFAAYISKKECTLLSHLTTHLNLNSLNNKLVVEFCYQFKLFDILIYLFSYAKNEKEIMILIDKMYEAFDKQKNLFLQSQANDNFQIKEPFSYMEQFIQKGESYIESSYEFYGHKLIWYIKSLIDKLSQAKNLENSTLLPKIFIFLLSQEIFIKLSLFDSYIFFSLLEKIYNNDSLISSLTKTKFEIEEIEKYSSSHPPFETQNKVLNYSNLSETISYIISITNKFSSFYVLQDMNMFLIRIAPKHYLYIPHQIVIDAINRCLSFDKEVKTHSYEELYDKFLYHGIKLTETSRLIQEKKKKNNQQTSSQDIEIDEIGEQYVKEISHYVIKLLNSKFSFEESEIDSFIATSEFSPFYLVKIKLFEMRKNYINCLDLYIKHNKAIGSEKLFTWIDNTMTRLKDEEEENSYEEREKMKNHMMDKINSLVDISSDSTLALIDKWYTENQKVILVQKLGKNPLTQFKYVEQLIEENISAKYKSSTTLESDEITILLTLHLDLLIKLGMKDKVLPNIKKRTNLYPITDTIHKCVENDVVDASIYLYMRTGESKEALELALKEMDKLFEQMDEKAEQLSPSFVQSFEFCIKICESSSDKPQANTEEIFTSSESNQETWFRMLRVMNNYLKIKEKNYSLNEQLSSLIVSLLKKMSMYVHVDRIANEIYTFFEDKKIINKFLTKVFSSFLHLKNYLIAAEKLLSNGVVINVYDYVKVNRTGNKFSTKYCNYCKRKLINDEYNDVFYVFRCGHQMHEKCAKKLVGNDNEPLCIVCKKNEIENSLSNIENSFETKMRNLIKKKDDDLHNSISSSSHSSFIGSNGKGGGEKGNRIKLLKNLDKKYLEQFSMLEEEKYK